MLTAQSLRLGAVNVDTLSAERTAQRWFASRMSVKSQKATPLRLERRYNRAYAFARGGECVYISTNDNEPAILGYGNKTPGAALPRALEMMLQSATSTTVYPPEGASWQKVEPLLTTTHNQYAPYNNLCPYYTSNDGTTSTERCIVGCVATAMEQVLTYHRLTYTLADTLHGWQTDHYTIPDILPGASVNSALILDRYDRGDETAAEIDAVARLSYWLGMAAHMNWGMSSSGANSYRLVEPLRRAFALPSVNYLDSYSYDPTQYWNYIAHEIMASRPVYYAGYTKDVGGHAFVLDGLDDDGMFHVQWGEESVLDGYFRLDVLNPTQIFHNRADNFNESGYFCNQEAISVDPFDRNDNPVPDTLSRNGREIAVDSLYWGEEPVTDCFTPLYAIVRNTTDHALTTPFAVLLNLPTDTAWMDQARVLAFSGRTLNGGERDTLCIPVTLLTPGRYVVSLTADGENLLRTLEVDIRRGGEPAVGSETPIVTHPTATSAEITQTFLNPSATERGAHYFGYDLLDNATGRYEILYHYIYLAPSGELTEKVTFEGLVPGRSYTFRLRRYWNIVQSLTFTQPEASGISENKAEKSGITPKWYTPDGRMTDRPAHSGVYLRQENGQTRKVLIK